MNKYFKLKDIDKYEIPKKKGYKAKLIKDTINGIGFYIFEKTQNTIDKENAEQELNNTTEKLVECFEYFLFKIFRSGALGQYAPGEKVVSILTILLFL